MAGGVIFKLGSFGNFCFFKKEGGWPQCTDPPSPILLRQGFGGQGLRRDTGASMAMIVLSSPATLAGFYFKKTGPSRFIADF
jgi:hypothetical protein